MKTLGIWEHRAWFLFTITLLCDSLASVVAGFIVATVCAVISWAEGEP